MIILGDARHVPLQDGCVQCCVTSPPYWGLRDYQIAGQIGLEASPDAYVASMVTVFREVWRVLKEDGVLFLNLGDTYNNFRVSMNGQSVHSGELRDKFSGRRKVDRNLKEKDLVGIPWRVAFALQADGWYLRSDIIWSKPNPMPESVTDRPTKSHEYVFLLTKAERYFWDAEAVRESMAEVSAARYGYAFGGAKNLALNDANKDGVGVRTRPIGTRDVTDGRNVRSVWSIATQPYPGSHFATMPEKLAERCILAGSRPGDLVVDPFGGSGTTVRVARRLNRRGVMLDLNPAYLALADARISEVQVSLLESEWTA